MDLNIYDIIKGPVATDKAYRLNRDLKKLVLKVHPEANKPLVKSALEKLFNVKVENVRIIVRKGKNKLVRRHKVKDSLVKRAIVSLAEGYTLDFFDQTKIEPALNKKVEKKD